jgi:2-polyprenyl-6-methoxyphenol hydroxylase-like FAD-dependent oxidoreductase
MEATLGRPRALVIGGSVGGLFAAHLLRSIGWDVAVYERTAGDLGDRGTGIGTRPELFAVMRRIGLSTNASIGVEVSGRVTLGLDGRIVHETPVRAVTSAWSRIWRPLRRALPDACYFGGKTLTSFKVMARGVAALFSDGTSAQGELLVGADGLHSTVRAQSLPEARAQYAGFVAWRAVAQYDRLAPSARELLLHRMVFGFPAGELILSIPMPAPDDDSGNSGRCCHFVWFRPTAETALPDLLTDASGHRHGVSIPPPSIRQEPIATLKRDAQALLAPQLAALVTGAAQVILQPIFDLQSPRIAFDRVALIGDAAFVARPHVATGVMKAALDAACLADALSAEGDAAAALMRYERERQPYGAWLVERGRHIARAIAARDMKSRIRIETVMREYGAAGLVRDQSIAARLP